MNRAIKADSTNVTIEVVIVDTATGLVKTNAVYNSAGIAIWYWRLGTTSVTTITLSAITNLNDSHSDGGFKHIYNGIYRLDLPDSAVQAGVDHVIIAGAMTGAEVVPVHIDLVTYDKTTAWPTSGGGSGTGSLGISIADNLLRQQSSTAYPIPFKLVSSSNNDTAVTGATPAVTVSKNGGSFGAISGAVTELANGIYLIAGNATDRATLGTSVYQITASGAKTVVLTCEIVDYDPFGWKASLRSAMGLASNNLDTQLLPLATVVVDVTGAVLTAETADYTSPGTVGNKIGLVTSSAALADAVWDEDLSGHATSGTAGKKLADAASAGDPWGTNLDAGSYIAGTAGHKVKTYLNKAITELPTTAQIADAVWDEPKADHNTANTTGAQLNLIDTKANNATEVWSKVITGITTTGTAAKLLQDAEAGSSNIAEIGGVTIQAYRVVPVMGYNPQGNVAQVALTLVDQGGKKVSPTTLHASPTCSVTVREHGSGVNLFTTTGTSSDVVDGVFELEQSAPNFTDNVLYEIDATITANSIAYRGTEVVPVMGA